MPIDSSPYAFDAFSNFGPNKDSINDERPIEILKKRSEKNTNLGMFPYCADHFEHYNLQPITVKSKIHKYV